MILPARIRGVGILAVFTALLAAALLMGMPDVFAQGSPFGVGPPRSPAPPPPPSGFTGWILTKQAEFYRQFSALIRASKADGSAALGLLGLSFLYGIFHAAGPGHGKAVISSYMVANDETWRRGVVLSFASALMQAMTAIAIVGIAAALLGATAGTMRSAAYYVELASYALIATMGGYLLWVKGCGFLAALRSHIANKAAHHGHDHPHDHGHAHGRHDHDHHHDHHGHSHGPEPSELAGRGGWQRGLSAIVAVGLRPCSGAIIVLVFALAQGLFWTGVGATLLMGLGTAITVTAIAVVAVGARGLATRLAVSRPGAGLLALRGLEVVASAVVLAFGALLLTGYMASERMFGF